MSSIFKREMQRNAELAAQRDPDPDMRKLVETDPEMRAYMAQLQACLIAWEPWTAMKNGWDIEECLAPYEPGYLAVANMVSCCMMIDRERYMELYIKHRDHDEFSFQEFFNTALLMAHEDPEFEWDDSLAVPQVVRNPEFGDERWN